MNNQTDRPTRSLAECLGHLQATIIYVAARFKADYTYYVHTLGNKTRVCYQIITADVKIEKEDIFIDNDDNYERQLFDICASLNSITPK